MAKINIRSPYHIHVATANLTAATLDLYVYTGTQTTSRGAIKYTQPSTAQDEKLTFEISELVRDFLDVAFSGTYTSQMVWVDYQITKVISDVVQTPDSIVLLEGFDGYGYFENDVNPQLASALMQSNTIVYVLDTGEYKIPISNDLTDTVEFYDDGFLVRTTTIVSSALSSGQIEYLSEDSITYQARVLADGGTFEDSTCLQALPPPDGEIDTIIVTPLSGDPITVTFVNVNQCKYTAYKVTFVNKFGALQDIWFFKRSDLTLRTTKDSYKGNILVDGDYSISEHQYKTLTKQGREKLVLNSGFVDEQYNEVFRQLMLSEKVWISYESNTLPLEIPQSSLKFKQQINERLINYTIQTDFAFDKINNVR